MGSEAARDRLAPQVEDLWRCMFQAAGLTRDGHRVKRPARPLELWRGTVPERLVAAADHQDS